MYFQIKFQLKNNKVVTELRMHNFIKRAIRDKQFMNIHYREEDKCFNIKREGYWILLCYNGIMQTKETVITRRAYSTLNLSIPDIATVNSSVFEGSIESTRVSIESTNVTMINESAMQSMNISSEIGNVDGILYLYGVPPLILFCVISIVVNIKVLMSVFWIRRPLSPTLYISLSLAGNYTHTHTHTHILL